MKETNVYKNLAKGIVVTGSTTIVNPDVVTNGDTQADSGAGTSREFGYSSSAGLQYVQIDLGATFAVNKIVVWHYNGDGRTYHNTKTQVSANGSTWVTVFDSATQGEYAETLAGKTHTFTQQNVRYVRDYLNGSTVNPQNHWTEIEVWGVTSTAYVGDYFEWNGSPQTMTQYYYAGTTRVAVRNGNGTGANGLVYLLSDHLGSASLTADPLDGDKLSELRYKAWGETRYALTSLPTDRRYTGQIEEAGIGLYYFNARWYDSALSRFTSADSIIPAAGQVQSWDRYAAMGNNPVKYIDPTGHAQACADGDWGGGCGSSGNIPDKEKLEIIRKERKESGDAPFDASLGGNSNSKLTTTQKVGKGITYMTVMVFIVFPTEVALIGASITAAAAGPEGVVVDALLLPLEITVADFGISYGIKTYKEIESGQNVEFTWTILPAIAFELPGPIQEELHNTFPRIFP